MLSCCMMRVDPSTVASFSVESLLPHVCRHANADSRLRDSCRMLASEDMFPAAVLLHVMRHFLALDPASLVASVRDAFARFALDILAR